MSMNIKEILLTQEAELLDIDLDCLEEQLETGDYDYHYAKSCKATIAAIRQKRRQAVEQQRQSQRKPSEKPELPQIPLGELSPHSAPSQSAGRPALSKDQQVMSAIEATRVGDGSQSAFIKLVRNTPELDERFVKAHINELSKSELSTLIERMSFSEEFLEQYFPTLDHNAIARWQTFSEEFFIKHFTDLSATTVLKQGKNSWRKKENRSNKLDAFLRLKGVRY